VLHQALASTSKTKIEQVGTIQIAEGNAELVQKDAIAKLTISINQRLICHVLHVANHWMPQVQHVHTNLVSPTRDDSKMS
jgi:hypothetical protein